MAYCDQHTVAGYPCKQKATWEQDQKVRRHWQKPTERYCTQHANIYGVPRGEASGRSRRIDADGNVIAPAAALDDHGTPTESQEREPSDRS